MSDPFYLIAVDDQESILAALHRALSERGFRVDVFSDPLKALEMLAESGDRVDVLVTDMSMPGLDGMQLLEQVRDFLPELPIAVLTADRSARSAVRALELGAFTYLTKPVESFDAAAAVLRGAASHRRIQRELKKLQAKVGKQKGPLIVANKGPMRELMDTVARVAKLNVSVLLQGESGSGKELVARAIHDMSDRASGPFVALNCAAIPEGLVDSELFGHVRGAFTGAVEPRPGVFERAHGGTLFLDEIGDLVPAIQVRLLRVLQERQVMRIGGSQLCKVDIRLVTATLVDLPNAIEQGEFRADLYYRLDVVTLELPSLRERPDDIALLATHLLDKHAARMGLHGHSFRPETMEVLRGYDWPGNVRELENTIQRVLALSSGGKIGPELLPKRILAASGLPLSSAGTDSEGSHEDSLRWTDGMSFADARKQAQIDFERSYMERLLASCHGNISAAARTAGLDRSNLRRVLSRVGLKDES